MRMRATLPVTGATPATPANRRRILTVAVVIVAMLTMSVVAAPAADGDGFRRKLLRLVNHSRANHGLQRLRLDSALSNDARAHTRKMIREDRIYDPYNLGDILADYSWDQVGADVVGCAATLGRLHRAFMNHAPHRSILLNRNLRRVGMGVIKNDTQNHCGRGSLWATEIFYG
jgi:uncharacterized protein YkwD